MAKNPKIKKQDHPQTAEAVIKKMEVERETKRQRAIVRDEIYPIVLEASKNITGGSIFAQTLLMTFRHAANKKIMDITVGELGINDAIDKNLDKDGYYGKVIDILSKEKIGNAGTMMEGIANEIERLLKKEQAERPLSSLKTDFIQDDEKNPQ